MMIDMKTDMIEMTNMLSITQQLKKLITPKATRQFGALAENWAQTYLETQGLTLIARNYQCFLGELDLIMRDQNTCVFVEVRARRHQTHDNIMASITDIKQARLLRAATAFLQQHAHKVPRDCRFDIITIVSTNHSLHLEWSKDILLSHDLGESSPWIF